MLSINGEIVRRKAYGKESTRVEGVERVITLPYIKLVWKDKRNIKMYYKARMVLRKV
jgi:hypothetical protein